MRALVDLALLQVVGRTVLVETVWFPSVIAPGTGQSITVDNYTWARGLRALQRWSVLSELGPVFWMVQSLCSAWEVA